MAGRFVTQVVHNVPDVEKALRDAPVAALRETDRALGRAAFEIADEAKRRVAKDTSQVANSIRPERRAALEHHVVASGTRRRGYAGYLEDGTKEGGRPSINAITAWIRRKNLTSKIGLSRKQLAHVIRMRIAQRGTPAQPFMAPALEAKRSRVNELVRAGLSRALQEADAR